MNMTKIFLFINLASIVSLASPVLIELGEEYTLSGKTNKIWIENAKVLTAQSRGQSVVLKGKTLGMTLLRQNERALKVVVVPINSKNN